MVRIRNALFFLAGLIFLILNKIRHSLIGYTTPRTFPAREFSKAIEYDSKVVRQWLHYLRLYSPADSILRDKCILELGPGADLGTGFILLMHGVKKYNAIDVNNLAENVPVHFYQNLFNYMENQMESQVTHRYLQEQLDLVYRGKNDRINYVYSKAFDLYQFADENINLVFSQAAFEHFDDFRQTIVDLSKVVLPGAVLVTEIDLKTHTRWIRDRDPLNIYRYPESIYRLLKFKGSPNRLRPCDYEEILSRNGWGNIKIFPLSVLGREYIDGVFPSLNTRFRQKKKQMDYLSVILCSKKLP
ncbi:MAG: methyltransferase domain-containing protein [Spirochaetales bacterium]|nr:methyltransferase domain-containing protein [Spirochaetales bacterium]